MALPVGGWASFLLRAVLKTPIRSLSSMSARVDRDGLHDDDGGLPPAITVVAHRVIAPPGEKPYPLYVIHTQGPDRVHVVERRWSELRALHVNLWAEWKTQLLRSGLAAPRFWQHTYGKARLDAKLLANREREMEALLIYFSTALQLRLIDTAGAFSGPWVLYAFLTERMGGGGASPAAGVSTPVAAAEAAAGSSTPACPEPATSSSGASSGAASSSTSAAAGTAVAMPLAPAFRRRLKDAGRAIAMAGAGVSGVAPLAADEIPVDPPYQGRVVLNAEQLRAACEAPTPPTHWYTPSAGWPAAVAVHSKVGRANCCQQWLRPYPTDSNTPAPGTASGAGGGTGGGTGGATGAAAAEPEGVGELRVEVLEASGLPNLDAVGLTDCFALVAFEHTLARTCTIENDLEPRWHAEAPRAFRLPITHAHSTLVVALFDDDNNGSSGGGAVITLKDDDPIGRVLVQPSGLRPATVIDAWWPLQHKPCGERPGARGAVRLRLSVTWHAERTLLLQPAQLLLDQLRRPHEAPAGASLRLRHRRAERAALYALHGAQPDTRYSYAVFREYLARAARLVLALKAFAQPARAMLFWRTPAASAVGCLAWQYLTFRPRYLPSALALLLVLLLHCTYRQARRQPALLQPLPFWALLASLAAPAGVRCIPALEASAAAQHGAPRRVATRRGWLAARGVTAAQTLWTGTKQTTRGVRSAVRRRDSKSRASPRPLRIRAADGWPRCTSHALISDAPRGFGSRRGRARARSRACGAPARARSAPASRDCRSSPRRWARGRAPPATARAAR